MHESIELTPNGKEILKALESEGKYLFHGSPADNIEIFEPRQSTNIPDLSKPMETMNDGDPAVSATPYADLAIFRAIINTKNVELNHTSSFGRRGEELEFTVSSREILEQVKNKKGFVYVFNKSDFKPYRRDGVANENSMEWRSDTHVSPVNVIEVNYADLPDEEKISIV